MDTVVEQLAELREHGLWSLYVAWTGLVFCVATLAPMTAVRQWQRRGSSDTDTPAPYLLGLFGCSMWWRYMLTVSDYKAVALFTYNVVMQLYYVITICYFYTHHKRRTMRFLAAEMVAIGLLFVVAQFGLQHDHRVHLFGSIASSMQISSAVMCLSFIYMGLSKRRLDFIPFAPVLFTVIIELHAVCYGFFMVDAYMFWSNFIFLCCDGTLCAMFFVLPTDPLETQIAVPPGKSKSPLPSASVRSSSDIPAEWMTNDERTMKPSIKAEEDGCVSHQQYQRSNSPSQIL